MFSSINSSLLHNSSTGSIYFIQSALQESKPYLNPEPKFDDSRNLFIYASTMHIIFYQNALKTGLRFNEFDYHSRIINIL